MEWITTPGEEDGNDFFIQRAPSYLTDRRLYVYVKELDEEEATIEVDLYAVIVDPKSPYAEQLPSVLFNSDSRQTDHVEFAQPMFCVDLPLLRDILHISDNFEYFYRIAEPDENDD